MMCVDCSATCLVNMSNQGIYNAGRLDIDEMYKHRQL